MMHGGGHHGIKMYFLISIFMDRETQQVGVSLKTLTPKPVFMSILIKLGK
jgi:hypothetical protein